MIDRENSLIICPLTIGDFVMIRVDTNRLELRRNDRLKDTPQDGSLRRRQFKFHFPSNDPKDFKKDQKPILTINMCNQPQAKIKLGPFENYRPKSDISCKIAEFVFNPQVLALGALAGLGYLAKHRHEIYRKILRTPISDIIPINQIATAFDNLSKIKYDLFKKETAKTAIDIAYQVGLPNEFWQEARNYFHHASNHFNLINRDSINNIASDLYGKYMLHEDEQLLSNIREKFDEYFDLVMRHRNSTFRQSGGFEEVAQRLYDIRKKEPNFHLKKVERAFNDLVDSYRLTDPSNTISNPNKLAARAASIESRLSRSLPAAVEACNEVIRHLERAV